MSLVRLENICKSYQGLPVLEGANFRVENGEKIGLVGRNGCGKSTLFRVITGETVPDSGIVDRQKRARIACLAQLPDVPEDASIHSVVLEHFHEFLEDERRLADFEERIGQGEDSLLEEYGHLQERFTIHGGYEFRSKISRVLCGLGFSKDEFELPFGVLSGGQRTRLMLALVLLEEADLLLLDEPENHLDLQVREWLESFLKDWESAFVIISHDRRMLNTVTNRTVEVEHGVARNYPGNYDAYVKEKARVIEDQSRLYDKQQERIASEEAWINRFRYKNTKSRQVQSRILRLEKMERIIAPHSGEKTAGFSLGEVVRSGQLVLKADNLSMSYDALELYREVNFSVERGERVGIIGPNGSGKTTLLRHLSGQLPQGKGEVSVGHKVRLGYYDQQHSDLNENNQVIEELEGVGSSLNREQLRTFLGRFLFRGDDVFKTVASLSGGERSRVALGKLILSKANALLLDEPTNHLDIASRETLEEAFQEFPGAIVMVSHDRALIDRLVDKLIIVEDGRAEVFLGNYSRYKWKDGGGPSEDVARGDEALKIRKAESNGKSKRRTGERESGRMKKRLREVEDTIEDMETLLAGFDERMAELDPSDYEPLAALSEEKRALENDLAELYAEWETLSQEMSS